MKALRADGSSKRASPWTRSTPTRRCWCTRSAAEYLDATRGYPCTNWVEGVDASDQLEAIDTYHVTDEDIDYTDKWAGNPNGWQNEDDVP